MATKKVTIRGTTPAQDIKNRLEVVDAGDGVGGVFVKPDGQKFKKRKETLKSAKEKQIAEYRREASRLASMANKRVARLEANDVRDAPAYKGYIESGGRFSVKGKTYNELQIEVARMRTFINANTSTIKGVNKYLKEIADNTKIKYTNLKDLRAKAPKFFELSTKVQQYLRQLDDMAASIGYQKIWEAVNVYVADAKVDLAGAELDIDKVTDIIGRAISEEVSGITIPTNDLKVYESTTWFKLE
jgi:hypothetical protein